MELINQGRPLDVDSLSFSRSISIHKFSKLDGSACSPLRTTYKFYKLQVEMRQSQDLVPMEEQLKWYRQVK